ncbi:FKBP-type peptidyl-prolyl cis-trans isomerase [Curtobacterium ammoniigenes]|uniref:FKBP-type peptidyl-prolyl cis-trans isomerase n=1 Tax=Curtobacterium ammoniigenes TaxID=395387 RepID=UPI00082F9000|nr:hypothetical protein [Curtobacterium ammoniigenes]
MPRPEAFEHLPTAARPQRPPPYALRDEESPVRRIASALLIAAAVAASLAACSSNEAGPSASSCHAPASGSASDAVSASGPIGKKPTVSVPSPLRTSHTEVSVLHAGSGRVLTDGSPAVIEYTIVSGATGKVEGTSGYKGQTTPIAVDSKNAGAIGRALNCSRVGDRLAIVTTAAAVSGTGATGSGNQSAVVVIADITDGFPSRATGTPQVADDGMPTVVLAPDGAPGISVPSSPAPTTNSYHLLRKGRGPAITTKDTAVIKYTAVTWEADSTVSGSTWTDGSGALSVPLNGSGQVPTQIRAAIVGHQVGDQVLAIIPSGGTTYAYVFDILGVMPH